VFIGGTIAAIGALAKCPEPSEMVRVLTMDLEEVL
jgi:hypothetical protein